MNTTVASKLNETNAFLDELEPRAVWSWFRKVTLVPRDSGKEEHIRDFLLSVAETKQWATAGDQAGNIVLKVPGKGRGTFVPPLALQAHMDMVCVARPGVKHDFTKDPIIAELAEIELEGKAEKVVRAKGTTLGADNGIGVAIALAAATAEEINDRPPLELLFTVDEERGLRGARKLGKELLSASRLINCDTERPRCIRVNSAGAEDLVAEWSFQPEKLTGTLGKLKVSLKNFPGGHSGLKIGEGIPNPINVLANALRTLAGDFPGLRLLSISGGDKRNAIPTWAEAHVALAQADISAYRSKMELTLKSLLRPWHSKHSSGEIELTDSTVAELAIPQTLSADILTVLSDLQDGTISMSKRYPVVATSSNLGVLTTNSGTLGISVLTRSSEDGEVQRLHGEMKQMLEARGATVTLSNSYSGWEARPDEKLLLQAKRTYQRLYHTEPTLIAMHGGIEPGAFRDVNPALEMISCGPYLDKVHTPDEFITVESVGWCWGFLSGLMQDLCE